MRVNEYRVETVHIFPPFVPASPHLTLPLPPPLLPLQLPPQLPPPHLPRVVLYHLLYKYRRKKEEGRRRSFTYFLKSSS
jgi:hypothetical protein